MLAGSNDIQIFKHSLTIWEIPRFLIIPALVIPTIVIAIMFANIMGVVITDNVTGILSLINHPAIRWVIAISFATLIVIINAQRLPSYRTRINTKTGIFEYRDNAPFMISNISEIRILFVSGSSSISPEGTRDRYVLGFSTATPIELTGRLTAYRSNNTGGAEFLYAICECPSRDPLEKLARIFEDFGLPFHPIP